MEVIRIKVSTDRRDATDLACKGRSCQIFSVVKENPSKAWVGGGGGRQGAGQLKRAERPL